MKWLAALAEKIRERAKMRGYVCDACGAEIFDYPTHRLCAACVDALPKNEENVCDKCGRKATTSGVCLTCKRKAPKFTRGFSPFVYEGETAALVNRMKNGKRRLAYFFGEATAAYFLRRCKSEKPWFDGDRYELTDGKPLLVLPVPATDEALQRRGYNQAEELARAFVAALEKQGVAVEIDLETLLKVKETSAQKQLNFAARSENVAGAYHVHKRAFCNGRVIVLLDDIMTTGATGSECARLLLSSGAKAVFFVTASALSEQAQTNRRASI